MVFHRNAKIVDRGSLCCAPEYTGSKLQNDPYLCYVACSKTELSILGKKLGEQVKGRSPKKLKLLIAVPCVAHLIVQVLSFNMNRISSPQRVPRPSYPFQGKFGRSSKGSFTEKAKIIDRGSVCIASERTCSKLRFDPDIISVACSQTELSISVEILLIR